MILCRKAREADLDAVRRLQHQGFHIEQHIPEDEIDEFLRRDPRIWVAESDGRTVGTVAAWQEGTAIHIGRLVTDPAFRGQHVATELLRTALKEIFDGGAEEVCTEARDIAVRILCGMGGKTVGEPYPFYVGNVTPVRIRKCDFRP